MAAYIRMTNTGKTITVIFDHRLAGDCDAFAAINAPMETSPWETDTEWKFRDGRTRVNKRRHTKEVDIGVKMVFVIWERVEG